MVENKKTIEYTAIYSGSMLIACVHFELNYFIDQLDCCLQVYESIQRVTKKYK